MAARRPLVVISGRLKQLPTADSIDFDLISGFVSADVTTALGYTPVNLAGDTMTGDLLVNKTNAVVGVGISGTRNGGIANLGSAGSGDIGVFSDHVNGSIYLRPNGRTDTTGQIRITASGNVLMSGDDMRIYNATADGADTARMAIQGGGAISNSRGAYLLLNGNEHASTPGVALLTSGLNTDLRLIAGGSGVVSLESSSGTATFNGDELWHEGNFDPTDYALLAEAWIRGTSGPRVPTSGGIDLDTSVGFHAYYASGGSNRPSAGNGLVWGLSTTITNEYGVQEWGRNDRRFFRTIENGVWQSWHEYQTVAGADAAYVPMARTVTAGNGMSGGGALSGNITLTLGTPSTLTASTTNGLTSGSHTHALDLAVGAIALTDPLASYPASVPVIGTTTGTVLTTLTVNASSNRAFQFLSSPVGGTTPPEVYVRSSHTTVGGGGWTSLARLWHDLNFTPGDYLTTATAASTYAPLSRNLVAGNGMTGGGTLAADRTFTLGTPSTLTAATTNAVTTTSHTHAITGFASLNAANTISAVSLTVNGPASLVDYILTIAGTTVGGMAADITTPRLLLYASTGATIFLRPDGRGSATGQATLTSAGVFTIPTLNLTNALGVAYGGTGGTSQATARTGLGLGTSATVNTGTSGATIPLLNAANTWSANQTLNADLILNTAGNGLKIKTGTNATMGTVSGFGPTWSVSTTKVTVDSLIFLTQLTADSGAAATTFRVDTITAGSSFTIRAGTGAAFASSKTIGWMIVEPA